MLIKFKVSNFLSFDEMQEFSMLSGKSRLKQEHIQQNKNDLSLLKFSALFGANASGKSSFVKAINYAKNVIVGKRTIKMNSYCKIASKNKDKITSFDFEIAIDEKYYSYGFDILLHKNEIKAEWLYELKKDKEIKIFVRELNKDMDLNEKYFKNRGSIKRLKMYSEDIKSQDNILFLTIMNENKNDLYLNEEDNINIIKKVYNWFYNSLVIIFPDKTLMNDSYYASEENLEKITEIVKSFGTGIKKCKFEAIKQEDLAAKISDEILNKAITYIENIYTKYIKQGKKKFKAKVFLRTGKDLYIFEKDNIESLKIKTIKFEHQNCEGEYSFSEESDGTIRILDLVEILLSNNTDKVYIIDELDRCLHPQLTYKFVENFLSRSNNSTQLIVTTHESRLLNFNLLRRDEIWFVNRENNGATKLYSLEEYNERFDKKVDKAYLDGRYGGVPIFETLFPVKEC